MKTDIELEKEINEIIKEIREKKNLYKSALEFWTIRQLAERIYCDKNIMFEWDIKK